MADDEMVLIEHYGRIQMKEDGFDGERNLSMNCHELRYLRRYLIIVGQWYPREWSALKVALYHIWQVIVTLAVWAHFMYSLGAFSESSLQVQYYKWFPINAIEDIIWNCRWVISHHLGLYYFCYVRHMEGFLRDSLLNQALWRETVAYLKKIVFAVFMLVFVLPVLLRPIELLYSIDPQDTWWIIMDTIVLAIDRLLTVPIFLIFVFETYILVRVVKGYGERICIWPLDYKNVQGSGMRAAKQQFVNNHSLISSVGKSFQLYLAVHFMLLLVTAFLGVFACAEQIETKITENHSYYSSHMPKYYKRMRLKPIIQHPVKISVAPVKLNHLYNERLVALKSESRISEPFLLNMTLQENTMETYFEAHQKEMLIEVSIEATLRILESIILYMIPLTLMLRLQTKLTLLQQTIMYLDCFDQQENGFLFQDEETIRNMIEFVGTCKGITIFGYKMPLFRAFLLSVFTPFVTALTTFLFSYIHVKRK